MVSFYPEVSGFGSREYKSSLRVLWMQDKKKKFDAVPKELLLKILQGDVRTQHSRKSWFQRLASSETIIGLVIIFSMYIITFTLMALGFLGTVIFIAIGLCFVALFMGIAYVEGWEDGYSRKGQPKKSIRLELLELMKQYPRWLSRYNTLGKCFVTLLVLFGIANLVAMLILLWPLVPAWAVGFWRGKRKAKAEYASVAENTSTESVQ